MVKVVLDIRKSLEANAAVYFEKAKKAKKKVEGATAALERTQRKLKQIQQRQEEEKKKFAAETEEKKSAASRQSAKLWFEKFHWFISSEGFLCIGGKDATTNEIIVKKHTDSNDIVFHTELSGSPFFVVKASSGKGGIGTHTIHEAAVATASYSRTWKGGLQSVEVFWVKPEQVTKEAKSGEYISKGAFMIYGKKNYLPVSLELALGLASDGKIMGGPLSAIQVHCSKMVKLIQGDTKPSDVAKKIAHILGVGSTYIDEIIRALPAGEFKLVKP